MYGPTNYNQTPYPQSYNIENIRVDGRAGVENAQMGPNGFGIYLDKNKPILWVKTTDHLMYPTITAYRIEPIDDEPVIDPQTEIQNGGDNFEKIEKRLDDLERMVRDYVKSGTSTPRRNQAEQPQQSGNRPANGNSKHEEHA